MLIMDYTNEYKELNHVQDFKNSEKEVTGIAQQLDHA